MWQKYVTRRVAVQVAQSWNFAWGEAMQKVYGVSLENTLVFRDDRKTEYYVDKKQHAKYVKGLYDLLKNREFVKKFHHDARLKIEIILQETKNKFKLNFKSLSNQELLKLYRDFTLLNVEQFYIRMWTVFNIAEPLANVVRNKLAEHVKDAKQIDEYLLKLSSPLKPNDVLNEKIDLLKLAVLKKDLPIIQFSKKIDQLVRKYRHIPMFDFDHEPYTAKHLLTELKTIKDPERELEKIKKTFSGHRKDYKDIVKKIVPDKFFLGLLEFLKDNVFLRDYRDMIRQKLNLELKKIYSEIGRRLGLTIEQVAILTNDEIINCLKNNLKFPLPEAIRRAEAYLLIQEGNKVQIYSGREAKKKFKRELGWEQPSVKKEIQGVVGSKGKARGMVKIVYTNKDLYKIKNGDILVATMTRQDFVPAMKKAKAIITDEGGIICHAAIIARELRLPAIVGTKNATQVLCDGMMVEVDADKGIIKILK